MNMAAIALAMSLLSSGDDPSQELERGTALNLSVEERQQYRTAGIYFLQWVGDDILTSTASGHIRRIRENAKDVKWSAQLEGTPQCDSLVVSKNDLYVLDRAHTIHVIHLADGKLVRSISRDQLARSAGDSRLYPRLIAWIPKSEQLFVAGFADKYGLNSYLFDSDFRKVGQVKTDGFVRRATVDSIGRYITTAAGMDNIRVWDTTVGKEIFKHGRDEFGHFTDLPFASNANFDGKRTLVYTMDGGWGSGTVFVHDTVDDRELAHFDSRNGHAVMDVDFAHGRIALTGTSRGLMVLDLDGNVIAEKKSVTLQRNHAVAFSKDGERLVIGSEDGIMRVLSLKTLEK